MKNVKQVVFHASLTMATTLMAIYCVRREYDFAATMNIFAAALNFFCTIVYALKS